MKSAVSNLKTHSFKYSDFLRLQRPQEKGPTNKVFSIKPRNRIVEAQVLSRILVKARVIVVSNHCDPKLFTDMHMMHAKSLNEALEMAEKLVGGKKNVTIIPDGIAVIVR